MSCPRSSLEAHTIIKSWSLAPFETGYNEISIPTSAFHGRTPGKFKRPAKATKDQQLLGLLDFRLVVLVDVDVEMSSTNSATG